MKTLILPSDAAGLAQAAELLRAGEIVAMPTETVYGLAGHAFDERAVLRIFEAKERPKFDPLIVHLAQAQSLSDLAGQQVIEPAAIPAALHGPLAALIAACWPGPLTLVLPRHARVPELVTAGLGTVALRVPAHPAARALLAHGMPLAAPSANRFGRISPTSAQAVLSELEGRIPLILDGGPCSIGLESTVIGLEPGGEALSLLRPGHYGAAELAAIAGVPVRPAKIHPAEVLAPGMLKSHYAPDSSLRLVESQAEIAALLAQASGRPGLLLLSPNPELQALAEARGGRCLAADGSLASAARGLFANLRALDGLDLLIAELPPQGSGLAHALRDRLGKAAAPKPD